MNPAIFLDRDNTIIHNDGDLGDPEQVRLIQGAAVAIASLRSLGYRVIVVTNQGGVARGKFGEQDVEKTNQRINELIQQTTGATIDRFYYCPYHPQAKSERYRAEHPWRKPRPGMLLQGAKDLQIDLSQSWMIGDQQRDVEAGQAAGVRTILLASDAPEVPVKGDVNVARVRRDMTVPGSPVQPNFVARSLVEAVRIVAQQRKPDGFESEGQVVRGGDGVEPGNGEPAGEGGGAAAASPVVKPGIFAAAASHSRLAAQDTITRMNPAVANLRATARQVATAATAASPATGGAAVAPPAPAADAPLAAEASAAPLFSPAATPPAPEATPAGTLAAAIPAAPALPSPPAAPAASPSPPASAPAAERRPAASRAQAADVPARAAAGSDAEVPTLRLILQELRSQRTSRSDFSFPQIAAIVLQAATIVCLLGALFMGAADNAVFFRWIAVALLVQLAVIAALMFRR